ncbi:MAG: extracellular solute-binding protein [Candidatus Omnitrophota bacterium]|nr:extracellular solute-binding protein [Candidatus Omnitrophota bacterium]MDZ4243264.1 extracellular solute-binding protein [Candidatus Omnitrophota bacterium]
MSKNRIFAVPLLAVLIFHGCSQPPAQKNTPLVIWHWMTDRHQAFETLARKYEEQTGVKVLFELYAPSDIYSQKVIVAAQARVLPDIFGVLDKKSVFASFIENGFVADLTDEFAKDSGAWEKVIFPKALAVNRFNDGNVYRIKPGIYGVPIDVTNIQMLYNKKLLQKAGIADPPATFEDFIEAAAALKRVGVGGLVSGWGELWMVECFASNYAFNIMGEDKVLATYRGEVPYTDPEWIRVFEIFQTLSQSGALAEGIVTKTNKYAEQDFALERAAFAFNGSWCVNVYKDMNPDLEYGVMLPPAAGSAYPMRIWGGAGSSFVVNDMSGNKEKAVAFLRWITAKEQQTFLAEETKNLPSNKESLASIPKILSEFAATMDFTTHRALWENNEDPVVLEAFNKGVQSIVIGEKTPRQVAEDVQKMKARQMEKLRNKR